MAIEEVGARLSLKDRAAFSRGMRDSERDIDRLGRSAKTAGGHFSAMGRLAGGVAKGGVSILAGVARTAATGIGLLTAAAGAASISLVNLASDAAETESKFFTVFGPEGSAQVTEWIRSVQSDVHIATDELQNAAATFGVFGQAIGVPASELGDFSTALAAAGLDLASFSNASPEDVFLALRSGLAGESEPLRQFGIFLSDASLNAFAAAEGIGKTTQEMTEQEKVLLRQKFILENLGAAEGDLARTSEGYANRKRDLLGVFRDLRKELGDALMPAAEQLLPVLSSGLGGALTRLRDRMPEVQRQVAGWTETMISLFGTIREGRTDTDLFETQMERVFGRRVGGFLADAVDAVTAFKDSVAELGVQDAGLAQIEGLFGPGVADTVERILEAGRDIGIIFNETLIPAWQGAQETLGPLAGASLTLLAEGLGWAADNAAELAPWVEKLLVVYITSSAVNTVFRLGRALQAAAAGMFALSAGSTAAATGGGAGLLARILGVAGGAAGLAGAGVGAGLGIVVGAAVTNNDPTPLSEAGISTPMPMPGEPPPGSGRANAVSIQPMAATPVPTGSDSWNRSGPVVNVSPTYHLGTSLSRAEVQRLLRENQRTLVEEVTRGVEMAGVRQ